MINKGKIVLEVEIESVERFLNELIRNDINITRIKKINVIKLRITVSYRDISDVAYLINKMSGKYKIIKKSGMFYVIERLKRKITIVIGCTLFFCVLYGLSNYIWAVDIDTGENVAPFDVRKELRDIGIKPGISKNKINDKQIEKTIESIEDRVLWVRIRIEGVTLKVKVLEKVNPPKLKESDINDCVAKVDGQVKRVYVKLGTALVKPGDIVKEGQVLIKAQNGAEGATYETPAEGSVIADTFYDRSMEVNMTGKELKKTGRSDKDVFIKVFGYKIYLKKYKNKYQNYDRIEEKNSIFNIVKYNETVEEDVDINREEAVKMCEQKLKESLEKELTGDSVITDYSTYTEDLQNGKISIKVIFSVEQDIILKN